MATPSAKRPASPPKPQLEVVDPRWLLKAVGLTLLAGAILAYLAICLLLYLGSWQFFLHPSAKLDAKPTVPFETVHFDAAATGAPRLTGWWIPAPSPTQRTILFLHGGSGNLSANTRELTLLSQANANVFAIDYRGFGASEPTHPSEARMTEDAQAAFDYLVDTRHIADRAILPAGSGLGAALALHLARTHPDIPALILDNPDPDAYERARTDPRAHFLPMSLLLRDRFDLQPLQSYTRPRMLIAGGPAGTSLDRYRRIAAFYKSLPGGKTIVEIPPSQTRQGPDDPCNDSAAVAAHPEWFLSCPDPAFIASTRRFLDDYIP